MHGVTMVFLVVMPIGAAFMNYLMPLQIGARDVAFPRLNAFSFWIFLFGGLFLNTSLVPRRRRRRRLVQLRPEHRRDLLARATASTSTTSACMITGIASLVGAINLIVTVLNMRAPGHDAHEDAGVHLDDPGRRSSCCCSPSRSSPWRCSC